MKACLRVTGPDLNREVVLDSSGAEFTLGRDPAADMQLIDPQKHISRKHVAMRQVGDKVELRVASALNGVDSSHGPISPGELVSLAAGDHFALGPYRIEVLIAPSTDFEHPRRAASSADDPFAALLGRDVSAAPSDDPFALPGFRSAPLTSPSSNVDPFEQLVGSGKPAAAAPTKSTLDPLGIGVRPSVQVSNEPGSANIDGLFGSPSGGQQQLNDWLGGAIPAPPATLGSTNSSGPLDAFLGRTPPPARTLSPDHVHGFNLPITFRPSGSVNAPTVSPAGVSSVGDMWTNLLSGADPAEDAGLGVPREGGAPNMFNVTTPPSSPAIAGNQDKAQFADDPFDDWPDSGAVAGDVPAPIDQAEAAKTAAPTTASNADAAGAGGGIPADPTSSWAAFARGLGLPQTYAADAQAAEQAGAMVRLLIEGLAELLSARADLKREMRAEERTMLSGRDNNPLKAKLSAAELVQYMFATQKSGAYMPAERAIRESIAELRVHEHATIAASRAAVQGALRDFEPGRLRKQLAKGKAGMFQVLDNARLWEAYEKHYEVKAQQMADWLEAMFARHFMPTYMRESERLKADGQSETDG